MCRRVDIWDISFEVFTVLCNFKRSLIPYNLQRASLCRIMKTSSLSLAHSPTLSLPNFLFCLPEWRASVGAFEACCLVALACVKTGFSLHCLTSQSFGLALMKYTYAACIMHVCTEVIWPMSSPWVTFTHLLHAWSCACLKTGCHMITYVDIQRAQAMAGSRLTVGLTLLSSAIL